MKRRLPSSPVSGVACGWSSAAAPIEVPLSLLFALSGDDAVVVGARGDPIGGGGAKLKHGLTSGHQLRRAHRTL